MSGIKWYGPATVVHLNVRKTGPEDEKTLNLDVKLAAIIHSVELEQLDAEIPRMLFRKDGKPRVPLLDPLRWKGEIRHMQMEVQTTLFSNVTLHKFDFEPMEGFKVGMTFTASFAPTAREAAILAECLAESVVIVLAPQPDLFDGVDTQTGEVTKKAETSNPERAMEID